MIFGRRPAAIAMPPLPLPYGNSHLFNTHCYQLTAAGKPESDDSSGHAARRRPVRRARPLRLARFHEDMEVPDWFDPGQVDVSDSAPPPRGYPPNVDSLVFVGCACLAHHCATVTY
jgi:hypothetical protein